VYEQVAMDQTVGGKARPSEIRAGQ
jgi:hypothetical protein